MVRCCLFTLLTLAVEFTGKSLAWLFEHFHQELDPSTLRRWRKRGGSLLAWFRASLVLEEPRLGWGDFLYHYSRHFYPRGPAP